MFNLNEKYFSISERCGRNHQNKFCLRPLKWTNVPGELSHRHWLWEECTRNENRENFLFGNRISNSNRKMSESVLLAGIFFSGMSMNHADNQWTNTHSPCKFGPLISARSKGWFNREQV